MIAGGENARYDLKRDEECGDAPHTKARWLSVEPPSRLGYCLSMISAQTPLAFVARENRYALFRIMIWPRSGRFAVAAKCKRAAEGRPLPSFRWKQDYRAMRSGRSVNALSFVVCA